MKLEYILMGITVAGLFLAVLISQQVKKRKGKNGADYLCLRRIAAKQLDNSAFYTIVYSSCSQVKLSVGRPMVATYSSYIVAFRPGELFVIPLQFSGRQIISCPGFSLNRENVGAVRAGKGSQVTFCAADGNELCTLCVVASNTADAPFQPLNIQQKAQAEKFQAFLQQFTAEIGASSIWRNGQPTAPVGRGGI